MIILNNNSGFRWFNNSKCYTRGYIYDEANKLYRNEELVQYFSDVNNENEFRNKLKNANGVFSVVVCVDDLIFVSVDRIRSMPLFYSIYNDIFIISDDAYVVKEKIGNIEMDDVSVNEFMITGYVTNEDTLYKEIRQVQAGEYIVFEGSLKKIKRYSYYSYQHEDFFDTNKETLVNKLDNVHTKIFMRLIESLNGRTAVIPLSGGYDSRLIAVMLKRLGYENVICFSYGREGNEESKISKKIADYLGYRWIYVPYTNNLWYNLFNSKERLEYFKYGSNFTSLPHIQDWPAVKELKNKELIPKDSVFIPGHAADFLEGSHIPESFAKVKYISDNELLNSIYKKHYSLCEWKDKYDQYNKAFKNKICGNIEIVGNMTNESAANLFEEWDWKERQAKFICNSVRVYEFFGYEWRIPLWDNELIYYWSKIRINDRCLRKLYMEYDNIYFKDINELLRSVSKKAVRSIKDIIPEKIKLLIRKKVNRCNIQRVYEEHPLLWYGIMEYDYFKNNFNVNNHINSYLVNIYLQEINENNYSNKESILCHN